MRFCVDASAMISWLMVEQTTAKVHEFFTSLSTDDDLVAPPLLYPDCTSVLRVKAFEGVISHAEALHLVGEMLAMPIRTVSSPGQFALAHEISNRTRRKKAYDMQYVAVAVLERCEMVTLDGGVYQAAREQRIDARLLR